MPGSLRQHFCSLTASGVPRARALSVVVPMVVKLDWIDLSCKFSPESASKMEDIPNISFDLIILVYWYTKTHITTDIGASDLYLQFLVYWSSLSYLMTVTNVWKKVHPELPGISFSSERFYPLSTKPNLQSISSPPAIASRRSVHRSDNIHATWNCTRLTTHHNTPTGSSPDSPQCRVHKPLPSPKDRPSKPALQILWKLKSASSHLFPRHTVANRSNSNQERIRNTNSTVVRYH